MEKVKKNTHSGQNSRGCCWTGSEYIHKFITQLPKDYYLIPDNGAIKLVGHIYEWIWIKTPIQIYDSLPKDYYLVPNNETIKLECGFP